MHEKIVVVTLGNFMRCDDSAGLLFGQFLGKNNSVKIICGGNAPENITGEIIKASPEIIIIADTLEFGGYPGEYKYIDAGELEGTGVSTHGSLYLFIKYLKITTDAEILILGFQPDSLKLGGKISTQVLRGVKKASEEFSTANMISSINQK